MADNSSTNRTALVVGATGVVGWTLLHRLTASAGWRTIGLSRNEPANVPADGFVAVDLLDRAKLDAQRQQFASVSHVFLTTRLPGGTPAEEADANLAALTNLLDVLEPVAADLRHVCLVHGTKWYGSHLGPYRLPARETDPRHMSPNFYHSQYDVIASRQRGKTWTFSTLRPHTVWGHNGGTGNSLVTAIGVYAAISRALDLPLRFPGPPASYAKISQGVTATLLAEAMEWVATTPTCTGESFNITNGDVFRWQDLWPRIADFFGMEVGPVQQIPLAEMMADKAAVWDGVVRKHGLRPAAMAQLVSWSYLDGLLAATWDDISSTIKARRFGFSAAVDSEQAFLQVLGELRRMRILP
ncbi:SDR family oxidoreductase [Oceanibacterium hippocampi]|uniref:Short chain dehydrogenase n=1 Tax=Oceanibacterium hippocampi TaxID=745714 RepID=A0A1Y5TWJ7_9PROT|nr:SDR family oxidoreductase [Oceanibacterium hippocampi]SLN71660.1 short chain dehydrogenase [Oceanibacterium hippocampi]